MRANIHLILDIEDMLSLEQIQSKMERAIQQMFFIVNEIDIRLYEVHEIEENKNGSTSTIKSSTN